MRSPAFKTVKQQFFFSDFVPCSLSPIPLTHHLWRWRKQGGRDDDDDDDDDDGDERDGY